jgi:lipopolysaccharide transport system permease protein
MTLQLPSPAPPATPETAPPASAPPAAPKPVGRADAPKPCLVIRPSPGWKAIDLAELWRFRDLLMSLAARDLRLRYKQTALGVAWVVLQPLMAAGIFSFVFGKLANFPSHGVPYFLFSFAGLLGWNLFSNTVTKTSTCLVGNQPLISKVFFPRLVLPLSVVPSVLVDFAVGAAMLAVLLALCRHAPGTSVLLLPLWMAVLLLLALGVGLWTAALTVSYRDVQHILPVALQALLYASPIAYALSDVLAKLPHAWQRCLYLLNPLAAPLEAFRWSVLGVTRPPALPLACAAAGSLAVFLLGAYTFKRMERSFADVI